MTGESTKNATFDVVRMAQAITWHLDNGKNMGRIWDHFIRDKNGSRMDDNGRLADWLVPKVKTDCFALFRIIPGNFPMSSAI